jgi:hypothetical protein
MQMQAGSRRFRGAYTSRPVQAPHFRSHLAACSGIITYHKTVKGKESEAKRTPRQGWLVAHCILWLRGP